MVVGEHPRISRTSHELIIDGQGFTITGQLWSLAQYFFSKKGKALTNEEITEACDLTMFSLRTYVTRLRRLGLKISSIRGYGYRFDG